MRPFGPMTMSIRDCLSPRNMSQFETEYYNENKGFRSWLRKNSKKHRLRYIEMLKEHHPCDRENMTHYYTYLIFCYRASLDFIDPM